MGKEKYIKEVLSFFEKTPVASSRDIRLIINKTRIKSSYLHLFVHNLVKDGKIRRITRGFYTAYSDPTLAVFCFKPSYIGLYDSLSIHNLWEQEGNTVIITGKRVRTGIRHIMDSNVVLRRIDPKYIFGCELLECGRFYVPVSDVEKTLIDFVYFKELLGKDVLKGIKERADISKVRRYLKSYPKRTGKIVLKLLGRS